MKKAIVTAMSLFVMSMTGNVHAEEELIWNPTHVLGNMVIGYADFFVSEDGEASRVFTAVLEKDGSDNDFFDQLIVIGVPDSDRAMVIGIPAGIGGAIEIPRPANGSGKVDATLIEITESVVNHIPMVAHIDHWSDGAEVAHIDHWSDGAEVAHIDHWSDGVNVARDAGTGGQLAEMPEPGGNPVGPNVVAMEFDPVPEPPPVGYENSVMRDDSGGGGLFAESPAPGGTPPGPNMFE